MKNAARNFSIVAVLLVLSGAIAIERLYTIDEPLGRDVAGFAVLSNEMLNGRKLYSDLWERKPRLVFIFHSAAELINGYGPRELFLLNMVASVGSMVAIYFVGGMFFRRTVGNPLR